MDYESMAMALRETGRYKVLEKFDGREQYADTSDLSITATALVLDTETTGTDVQADKLVEFGAVLFEYELDGYVTRVLDSYSALEDPGMAISEEASRVNGITDAMVAGKRLDDGRIAAMAQQADFVIAHNASFDRAFCEKRFDCFADKAWGCSMSQVDWKAENIGSAKLDYLAGQLGFFYEAHRADMDCKALLEVLSRKLPSGTTGFSQLLHRLWQDELRVWALGAPFPTKDLLRSRGYRWGPSSTFLAPEKAWFKAVAADELAEESLYLQSEVYRGKHNVLLDTVTPYDRFSQRRRESREIQLS